MQKAGFLLILLVALLTAVACGAPEAADAPPPAKPLFVLFFAEN